MKALIAAVLAIPALLVTVDAASFHVLNRNNGSIISSGEKRGYLLYVPASYDRARPTPLVISLHGGATWPAVQRDITRWNRVAAEHGFIVVYPEGSGLHRGHHGGRQKRWNVNMGRGLQRDVQFISDLIDRLQATYNIDPTRIYADGLSNGGGMAFVLSCTLSDRIAAVGMVGSAQTLPWSWCKDERPVPMINFHGTADTFTPYRGGMSMVSHNHSFPGVAAWTSNWARRNRCSPAPVEKRVADDVTRIEYTNCTAPVLLYRIERGGHTWPRGKPMPKWMAGTTTESIDATREMWRFFRGQRLTRRSLRIE